MSVDAAPAVPHEDNTDPAVRTRVWHDGRLVDKDYSLARVSDHLEQRDTLVWIDLTDPDHDLLTRLADEIGLDPNSVEDAVARDERPKITAYPGYLFVTAYATSLATEEVHSCRISAFVLPHALVTVHSADWTGAGDVVGRFDTLSGLIAKAGSQALLYGLLDHIVDSQFATVEQLEDRVDALEDTLFDERPQTRAEQKEQFDLRRAVVALRRLTSPEAQFVGTLRRLQTGEHKAMHSYWLDLDDHIARVVEWVDQSRDLLNNVFSANMSLQDARLNLVMKKLTSWAAIIAVPTAITGFYGQNVAYPDFGTAAGFVVSTAMIVVAMAVLYVLFRRKGWL